MYGNFPCSAFYERAVTALPSNPVFHRSLADPALLPVLKEVAREIGYGLT